MVDWREQVRRRCYAATVSPASSSWSGSWCWTSISETRASAPISARLKILTRWRKRWPTWPRTECPATQPSSVTRPTSTWKIWDPKAPSSCPDNKLSTRILHQSVTNETASHNHQLRIELTWLHFFFFFFFFSKFSCWLAPASNPFLAGNAAAPVQTSSFGYGAEPYNPAPNAGYSSDTQYSNYNSQYWKNNSGMEERRDRWRAASSFTLFSLSLFFVS